MSACVEATRRCVRTTTITIRDREVRRDGGIFARLVGVQFFRTTPFSPQLLQTCLPSNKMVQIKHQSKQHKLM